MFVDITLLPVFITEGNVKFQLQVKLKVWDFYLRKILAGN